MKIHEQRQNSNYIINIKKYNNNTCEQRKKRNSIHNILYIKNKNNNICEQRK